LLAEFGQRCLGVLHPTARIAVFNHWEKREKTREVDDGLCTYG